MTREEKLEQIILKAAQVLRWDEQAQNAISDTIWAGNCITLYELLLSGLPEKYLDKHGDVIPPGEPR